MQETQTVRFFQGLGGREWKVTSEGAFFRSGPDAKWRPIAVTAAVLEQSRGVWEAHP